MSDYVQHAKSWTADLVKEFQRNMNVQTPSNSTYLRHEKRSSMDNNFTEGFLTKCAEAGLSEEQSVGLLKVAFSVTPGMETALSRAALGALLGGGAGGLMGGLRHALDKGQMLGYDEEDKPVHDPSQRGSALSKILAGMGSGMTSGGLLGGAYGMGRSSAEGKDLF